MKIGFDAKRAFHNNRGLGNYSRDLIRILQERNFGELILFNPKQKQKSNVHLTDKTQVITPKSAIFRFFKGLWRSFIIGKLSYRKKLDIYHGLSGEIPFGVYKKTPTIVTIHDLIFVRYPHLYSFFDRKIHFFKFKYAAQNAHHIIAISEQTKQDIIDFLGISSEKISVVYQGCHHAMKRCYDENKKNEIRKKFGLPQRFVLNVGAIEPRKNALEIVKAIKDLDISLVLVGNKTTYYEQIVSFCKENQMESRVITLQNISMEELAVVYQMADVFCYPSVFEGFGIPIIEALFSKIPVITSYGSCFSEAAGKYSVYIELDKASQQIKEAILQIQSNPDKRKLMVEEGYKHAQNFTDEAVFQNLTSVYRKIKNV